MKTAGFIGLGIMGRPMALNLRKGQCPLVVNDLSKESVQVLQEAGATYGTSAEIAQQCDVIFTILPDGSVVDKVLFGEGGIAAHAKPGTLVVDMSSVTPNESKSCAERLREKGIDFLDAPVSGGEPGAIAGTLAFMVGGPEKAFERAKPYFDIMGSSSTLVGDNGSGSMTKLVNQVIVNLGIAAVAEGFVLAAKAGVDPLKVYDAIKNGLAGSAVLNAKIPMMAKRDFKPGGKISINHKDIKNVLATSHAMDVPMPFTSQLFEMQLALKVSGNFEDDHGGYVQYFERLANVEVKEHKE